MTAAAESARPQGVAGRRLVTLRALAPAAPSILTYREPALPHSVSLSATLPAAGRAAARAAVVEAAGAQDVALARVRVHVYSLCAAHPPTPIYLMLRTSDTLPPLFLLQVETPRAQRGTPLSRCNSRRGRARGDNAGRQQQGSLLIFFYSLKQNLISPVPRPSLA